MSAPNALRGPGPELRRLLLPELRQRFVASTLALGEVSRSASKSTR
jgi:hypothetical protein